MTTKINYSIPIIGFIIILILFLSSCKNISKERTFDIEGNNNAIQFVPARDYQIEIVEDSLLIFDGSRHVGTIPFNNWDKANCLDSLIMIDND